MLPVLTGIVHDNLSGGTFGECTPAAIVVGPTRELVIQIDKECRKFSHGTVIRSCLVYGGVSVGYQAGNLRNGAHVIVGTPGRLLQFVNEGKVRKNSFFYIESELLLLCEDITPIHSEQLFGQKLPVETEFESRHSASDEPLLPGWSNICISRSENLELVIFLLQFVLFQISLANVRYLILDEADRMLDMGFKPEIDRLVGSFNMPPKGERQTLMFSATFPDDVQRMAADYLNDYLFITVGRVGDANTDITQEIYNVDQYGKREKLTSLLNESGKFVNDRRPFLSID